VTILRNLWKPQRPTVTNSEIVSLPTLAEREKPQQAANLYLKLFASLGVENVSLGDINIVHRVPSRVASNRPSSIICKCVRKLAYDNVMANKRNVNSLRAMDLGFKCDSDKDVSHMNLSPSLQERLHESKESTPSTSIAGQRMVYLFALHSITAQKKFRGGLRRLLTPI